MSEAVRILVGDVLDGLASLPEASVHCCVTSPPYWGLRDYGVEGQIGLEASPEAFVAKMVEVFGAVRRVLRPDGTLWLNLGDSYGGVNNTNMGGNANYGGKFETGLERASAIRASCDGVRPKDLCLIPWRVLMALQADGWYVRSIICWAKKSPMPESCRDRPTSSWEPIFLLAPSERYFFDAEAVKEKSESGEGSRAGYAGYSDRALAMGRAASGNEKAGAVAFNASTRNMRNVWHLGPEPYKEAHFATFPTEIPRRAIKAGTSEKGCCPACGAPWERVVERVVAPHVESSDIDRFGNGDAGVHRKIGGQYQKFLDANPPRTVGWEPGCACNAGEPVPCVVLDPFLGSGTTVAVARELGRHGVGCELNPEYARLARERIGRAERPQGFRSEKVGEAPLFAAG